MKRILAVGHAQDGSGFARVLRGILGAVCHIFDVHQLCLNGPGSDAAGDWTRHPCRDPNDVYGFDEFRSLLQELRPDIVFILQDLWIVPGYLDALEGRRVPLVAYVPLDGQLARPEIAYSLRALNNLVAYVPGAQKQFAQAFDRLSELDGLPTPQLSVIPHGIDNQRFYPLQHARQELFPDWKDCDDAFILLNANQNIPRKQLNVTIDAFVRFSQGKPENVKLWLHTAAEGYVDVRTAAEKCGIGPRLLLTGDDGLKHPTVSEERLNWIYNACDVGINTSAGEGWGLVSFEHGATGAAQIVPRHSACGELWEGAAELVDAELNPTSRHFPLRMSHLQIDGVAAAIERLYVDSFYRHESGKAARLRATSSEFSWPVISQQWLHLFDQVSTGG